MYLDLLALTGLNAGKKQFIMSRQEEIHFYVNMMKYPISLPNKKIIKLSYLKLTCVYTCTIIE